MKDSARGSLADKKKRKKNKPRRSLWIRLKDGEQQRGSLPSGRDAVNLLCAEPGTPYKSGCASTDGSTTARGRDTRTHTRAQSRRSFVKRKQTQHRQAQTCGPRRAEPTGDFSSSPARSWRVPRRTSADRRSSFAPPCQRIWTYARPPCRTACPGRT